MVNFDLDQCLKNVVRNKYEFILFAKARAYEIFDGSQSLVEKEMNEKPFFTSLKEISGMKFSYDDLNEKLNKLVKSEIFGIYADYSKSSVDQFDDSSIFAKSFLKSDENSKEKIELNDLLDSSSNNFQNDHVIKMIGSFENIDEELSDFTDGLEIFENDDRPESFNDK
jgi:DNA-directed RNA polymerase omega subunit